MFNHRVHARYRSVMLGVATALFVVDASVGESFAQGAPAPGGQGSPQSSIAEQVANFKSNPERLLTTHPNGGVEMTNRVREYTLNDRAVLPPMVGLIPKGNKDQKTSIGSGLAQAARIVLRTNREYSGDIQQAVAETRDLDAFTAYAAASGDTGTAATGAAGAGSAGASGGQTASLAAPGSGGGLEAINGSSVNTGPFSFTSSVTGVGSSSSNGTTTTTTISSTTSP